MSCSSPGEDIDLADRELEQFEAAAGKVELAAIPENLWEENLKLQLVSILHHLKCQNAMIRTLGLQKLSCILTKLEEHPSVQLPLLGQVVIVTCLCALDVDNGCDGEAATVLCQLLPIVRRTDDMLWHTEWGPDSIHNALTVLNFSAPVPSLFQDNSYNLAMVFGGYLPPKELFEAMNFLGGDAADFFGFFDVYCLFRELIRQFSGKSVMVQELLELLYANSKSRKKNSVATLAISVLATLHLKEVVSFLLEHSFRTCEDIWQAIFDSADPNQLIQLLLAKMDEKLEVNTVVQHATQVLYSLLKVDEYKDYFKDHFSVLFLTLLGQISSSFQENKLLMREPMETLQLLVHTLGARREETSSCWEQLSCSDGFSQGLCALVRILINASQFWIPKMVDYLLSIITFGEPRKLYEIAVTIYIELLTDRIKYMTDNQETIEHILRLLDHDSLGVRRMSLRGISSLILNSELMENPWCMQLALLNSLGTSKPDVLSRVMELLETVIPKVTFEVGADYVKMLAATYCTLIGHEEATVRAAAIKHLGLLRSRPGKPWFPTTSEETILEMVNVLIHLEDEDEVAEIRTYNKELVRGAALCCILHPNIQGVAVFKVAACFVGHLAHKKGEFLKKEDVQSCSTCK
ncbi:hypothetical protein JD844_005517 [Phrynosoma platyrhinos]|uniref:Uncharacterized protein n=1 Tax=Phrynosoma platyrhinos TaxID=52577 RepID=A0ABQ7TPB5_PHRPL|nr:hypothetical protein JD844_005517 [Phrynosoma platyrhinos]